jgi:preprotein translocase subunit SecF
MIRIIERRNWLFALSLALLVPGVIALGVWHLKLGIDFTGGAELRLHFDGGAPAAADLASAAAAARGAAVTVQPVSASTARLVMPSTSNEEKDTLVASLTERFGPVEVESFSTVGPSIGVELERRAATALGLVLLAIVLYISWAFRRVSRGPVPAWVYGASAVVSLIHDVLMVVGIFAILGHVFGTTVDSLFVTALLTVLGFSVHDTIVVFDRVRERLGRVGDQPFAQTVNESVNETLVRSINTSLTTMLVLTALVLFGGATIRNFVLALLIGIASGTYSSIFVASPLLVVYERWRARRR